MGPDAVARLWACHLVQNRRAAQALDVERLGLACSAYDAESLVVSVGLTGCSSLDFAGLFV